MLRVLQNFRLVLSTRRAAVNIRWFSDEDSSDDEKIKQKVKKQVEKNPENVNNRLKELLNSMTTKPETPANVIKAKNKRKEAEEAFEKKKQEPDPNDIRLVTQRIAEKIGGDVKKTEAELLSSLLGISEHKSSLSDILGGLTVEKEERKAPKSRAQMVRRAIQSAPPSRFQQSGDRQRRPPLTQAERKERIPDKVVSVNLFGGEPLGIFTKANDQPDICETWARLQKREIKLAVTHPPRNYFEKMILWTDQGKVWRFPIDNEQGWDEEHQTDFTEHIMLEMHLEGWCPTKGPVRHFMELVCVGLSKNNFLSAKEKYDHIMWYKGYFEEKRETLGELMTLGLTSSSEDQKQIAT